MTEVQNEKQPMWVKIVIGGVAGIMILMGVMASTMGTSGTSEAPVSAPSQASPF